VDLTEADMARAAQYDRIYPLVSRDPLVHDLHRQALGDDYPEGIDVTGSCTRGTLDRALSGLRLPEDGLLVDLGCGLGGPGRWLARRSGARVLGLDVSQAAVDAATAAAREYLEPGRYEYRRGSFSATGLPDQYADAVMAIEALPMAVDRGAVLAEIHRILRPGCRATFTGGDRLGEPSRWTPLIEEAGLTIVSSYLDEARSQRWLVVCALWVEHEAELRASLGDLAEEFLTDARNAPAGWGTPGAVGVQFTVQRPGGAGSGVDAVSLGKAERRCNGLIVEPATLGPQAFRLRAPP
jgi:SAM-dependent methyltransferase